jgi:hypothetical protein
MDANDAHPESRATRTPRLAQPPKDQRVIVDVIYLTFNRLAFTQTSFAALLSNTDWQHVDRLIVYDDGSEDGSREWVGEAIAACPVHAEVRAEKHLGPVAIMLRHLADPDNAAWFAKIDNDCCVPPGWLPAMLSVLETNPHVELLGMEAGMTAVPGRDGAAFDGVYGFEPATNIGGIGLMSRAMFDRLPAMLPDGRNGFSELQHTYGPVRGWIKPDLPVALLDRVPAEPWLTLSAGYIADGWQRPQGVWDPYWMGWAYEWLPAVEEAA